MHFTAALSDLLPDSVVVLSPFRSVSSCDMLDTFCRYLSSNKGFSHTTSHLVGCVVLLDVLACEFCCHHKLLYGEVLWRTPKCDVYSNKMSSHICLFVCSDEPVTVRLLVDKVLFA